jgi:hypothetical protein
MPFISLSQDMVMSGIVKSKRNGEPLPFVHVEVMGQSKGTISNSSGFFSIAMTTSAEEGSMLSFTSVGFKQLQLSPLDTNYLEDGHLDIELEESQILLEEISIEGRVLENFMVSKNNISIDRIKNIPMLFGENDVMKGFQLLPGVSTVVEGTSGLSVRGGGYGQNLILLDHALVYNLNHAFGLFSIFNTDAIKSANFWKSELPARYGGRASSAIDIVLKEGNNKTFATAGSVGLISSKILAEGPIVKDRSSFLVSLRRSYLDLLTRPFMDKNNRTLYTLFDSNVKLNYQLSKTNKLIFSLFTSRDNIRIAEAIERTSSIIDTSSKMYWQNSTATLRLESAFSNRLFGYTTFLFSDYSFRLSDDYARTSTDERISSTASNTSGVTDWSVKQDFEYLTNNGHTVRFGGQVFQHTYAVSNSSDGTSSSDLVDNLLDRNYEFGLYVENSINIGSALSLNLGLRYSGLLAESNQKMGLEPRINIRSRIGDDIELFGGYNRLFQYAHLISNTGAGFPTDLWIPADDEFPAEYMDQISLGVSKIFKALSIEMTLETFKRYYKNILSYSPDASFLTLDGEGSNDFRENLNPPGIGESTGLELSVSGKWRALTVATGYTLSWTIHQFDELNNGRPFYAIQDSRHNLNLNVGWKISEQVSLSTNFLFMSGRPINSPSGFYFGNFANLSDQTVIVGADEWNRELISERFDLAPVVDGVGNTNAHDYHRLDISMRFFKDKGKSTRTWEIGVFNAYNRKNPLYYFFDREFNAEMTGQNIVLKKQSFLPIIPNVSYSFTF